MYFKVLSIAVLFLCLQSKISAQSVSTLIGARANALGYASSCIQDEWSLFNNVAGMPMLNIRLFSEHMTGDHPCPQVTEWLQVLPCLQRLALRVLDFSNSVTTYTTNNLCRSDLPTNSV